MAQMTTDIGTSEKVGALQTLIDKAGQRFTVATISGDGCPEGQKVLKGCQSVRRIFWRSTREGLLGMSGFHLGESNLVKKIRERLILNTGLLNGFVTP